MSKSHNEFGCLVEALLELGMTQGEIASRLGISDAHLSRAKSGERKASHEHVAALRKLVSDREGSIEQQRKTRIELRAIDPPFTISNRTLSYLSPSHAVIAFRELLQARAAELRVPATAITISEDVFSPDGGVDAFVVRSDTAFAGDNELLVPGRAYQVKTGDFKPWQASVVRKELFGRSSVGFDSLGSEVQECLTEGGSYVLVCFGTDIQPKQRREACQQIRSLFSQCGFSEVDVDVWGQGQLIPLCERYPSICLKITGHDLLGIRTWDSWVRDADMSPHVHYSAEKTALMDDLRAKLRSGELAHLRLNGEPGVGKSRFALELTSSRDLSPLTLYVNGGRDFLASPLFGQLQSSDSNKVVCLVVDECQNVDRAEIWNRLKCHSDRVRLISIDHGPDLASDETMHVETLSPMNTEQIMAILRDYGVSERDCSHWAKFCEGSPRVAHVLGENLRSNRDLLSTPATVDVWDRFIVGKDDPTADDCIERRRLLLFASLFERFGYASPVQDEARFIAEIAGIPWTRFEHHVKVLRDRRILQGARTLYITPRLLHIYLFKELWNEHGESLDLAILLRAMPPALRFWLIEMLRFAHTSDVAEKHLASLLGANGLFPGDSFPDTQEAARLIRSLADACPELTLRCLSRTVGAMSISELHQIHDSRQWLVWTLERLAVRKNCFAEAAELLLRLAESENASNANNATGTFRGLFTLTPGIAATEADAEQRLGFLKSALESESEARRRIAVSACKSALDRHSTMRMIGPEYQGLRPTIEFWYPKTYGELWQCYGDVWRLLVSQLDNPAIFGDERSHLLLRIVESADFTLHIPGLEKPTISILRLCSKDSLCDVAELLRFLRRHLEYRRDDLEDETVNELQSLKDSLDGESFSTRLKRFVKYVTFDDYYDRDAKERTGEVDKKLRDLASTAISDNSLLVAEFDWLIPETNSASHRFGELLCELDAGRALLPQLIEQYKLHESSPVTLLSGYLAGMFKDSVDEWERAILRLAEIPPIAARLPHLVVGSGCSRTVVRMVIERCRADATLVEQLYGWRYPGFLRQIEPGLIEQLIELQLDAGTPTAWAHALDMCFWTYVDEPIASLPEDLSLRVLTAPPIASRASAHSNCHMWSRVAKKFLDHYPHRQWDLFSAILRLANTEWSVLSDLDMSEERILTTIVESDPATAFSFLVECIDGDEHLSGFGIQHWLGDGWTSGLTSDSFGPIQLVPPDILFQWVDQDIDKHGSWLAQILPKTLDTSNNGKLTRDFLARYGRHRRVARALRIRFSSRGWVGNISDMYRGLLASANKWLATENDRTVREWTQDYIDSLRASVDQAELEEERESRS